METQRTKADVKAEMHTRSESMGRRIDALEDEVTTAGLSLMQALKKRPLVSLGGAVLAGVALGLLLGGSKRRRARLESAHASLIKDYIDALSQDVRRAVDSGEEAGWAVRSALRDHVPLVVYRSDSSAEDSRGMLRSGFDLVAKTAFSLFVRDVIDDYVLRRFGPLAAAETRETADEVAPVASAVSEEE